MTKIKIFNILGMSFAIMTFISIIIDILSPISPIIIVSSCLLTLTFISLAHVSGQETANRTYVIWCLLLMFWMLILVMRTTEKEQTKEKTKTETTNTVT